MNITTVLSVRRFFRGIYAVTWRDTLNSRRRYETLFRRCADGAWRSGEANPTGCYSSPLRDAAPEIAAALDSHVAAQS